MLHGNTRILKIKRCKFLTFLASFGIQGSMKSTDEQILRATKEIVVKFIELGRLSPASVHESFRDVYATVNETVKKYTEPSSDDTPS